MAKLEANKDEGKKPDKVRDSEIKSIHVGQQQQRSLQDCTQSYTMQDVKY